MTATSGVRAPTRDDSCRRENDQGITPEYTAVQFVPVWVHASPCEFAIGEMLRSPKERGVEPRWPAARQAGTQYRDDVVYIMEHDEGAPIDLDRLSYLNRETFVYRVAPIGGMLPDLDPHNAIYRSKSCARARVVECLYRPPSR
jgi:hypothetical protein